MIRKRTELPGKPQQRPNGRANNRPAGYQNPLSTLTLISASPLQFQDNICRFNSFNIISVQPKKTIVFLLILAIFATSSSSCGLIHNLFGAKYGCPSDGKNVGAERILSGEKVPRSPKFKA